MVDFQNLGFETAGVNPGEADAWSASSSVADRDYAEYSPGTSKAVEDYEDNWDTNEDYLFFFTLPDIEAAAYETLLVVQKLFENYEERWSSNHDYLYGIGSPTPASYDTAPEDFEDYEEDWSSNQNYLFGDFGIGGTALASYDTAPEDFEDYEENWSSNQNYVYAALTGPPEAEHASYDVALTTYEDFENEWTLTMSTV